MRGRSGIPSEIGLWAAGPTGSGPTSRIGTRARAVGVTQIWGCVRTRWEMPCIPDLVCLGLADWDARCRGDTGVRAGVVEWEFRLSRFAPGWSDCLVLWSVITLADFANGMALVISMYVRYCGWLPSW